MTNSNKSNEFRVQEPLKVQPSQLQPAAHHRVEIQRAQTLNQIKPFMCAPVHSKRIQKTVTCSINVLKMTAAMTWLSPNSLALKTLHTARKSASALKRTAVLVKITQDR